MMMSIAAMTSARKIMMRLRTGFIGVKSPRRFQRCSLLSSPRIGSARNSRSQSSNQGLLSFSAVLPCCVGFDGTELLPPVLVLLWYGLALAAARTSRLRLGLAVLGLLLALGPKLLFPWTDLRRCHDCPPGTRGDGYEDCSHSR